MPLHQLPLFREREEVFSQDLTQALYQNLDSVGVDVIEAAESAGTRPSKSDSLPGHTYWFLKQKIVK